MAARAGPVPGLFLSCGFPLTQPGGRWERGAGLGRVQSPPLAPIGRCCRQSWFWRADWSERGAARARSRRQGGRGAAEAPLAERLCGPGSGGGGRSPVRRRRSSEAAPAQISGYFWCPTRDRSSEEDTLTDHRKKGDDDERQRYCGRRVLTASQRTSVRLITRPIWVPSRWTKPAPSPTVDKSGFSECVTN
ncbi:uncharacterized protein LOC116436924 isoform X2 [Corvus moneduloides]|uniref:uncharacterized protein LOC116436924 isoform X2 n=1 Tax=Corvus moneduloides TaxID=1196302 RepID=UPI0013626853|nr:uncharacterized protein LOC116436924 isoform X2 [Corvus moneduloides]